ncbi:MAG: Tad domain-containing protein, partial [Comamonas sp.]
MLFLLGFMGVALDFGRLFVVKGELQTAVDSCALAAARELNGQADAIVRAQSAGLAAGNANRVNLQSTAWNGQGKLTSADISFRDQAYAGTNSAPLARYSECQYTMGGLKLWLLQAMGAFTGDSANWANAGAVAARAVATRGVAQSACPVPVQLK